MFEPQRTQRAQRKVGESVETPCRFLCVLCALCGSSPRAGYASAGAGRSAGFTLVELLAVLVILSILGGLSAGAWSIARRNYALAASASHVEALFLQARNTALSAGIPVIVEIDPVAGTATAHAHEALGEWSFEGADGDVVRGLQGDAARLVGARLVAGRAGSGVDISAGHVDCGTLPRYDVRLGLQVEAWVLLERTAPPPRRALPAGGSKLSRRDQAAAPDETAGLVVAKGKAFSLGVTADGAIEGAIGTHRDRTAPGVVLSGVWVKLALVFEGGRLELLADGMPRDAAPVGYETVAPEKRPAPPALIPLDPAPLTIGAAKGSFSGRVDEVRVRGLIEPQEYALGARERFLGWRKVIHFDHRGHLDTRYHEKPVRVLLYLEPLEDDAGDRGRTKVFRDFSRTFEQWARSRGIDLVKEGMTEEGEEAKLEAELTATLREEIVIDRIGAVR
jgi:prepilin-type N-terminal cleavage/methylation domain-containing protein